MIGQDAMGTACAILLGKDVMCEVQHCGLALVCPRIGKAKFLTLYQIFP